MKNDRQPIYAKGNESARIVSISSDRWVYQERRTAYFSNKKSDWVNVGNPTTKEKALEHMRRAATPRNKFAEAFIKVAA